MILTGKAKEDFLSSLNITEEKLLLGYSEREITSLIIEWLDSVGIYISISADKDLNTNSIDFLSFVYDSMVIHSFTRQEAIKQAIIKANEIYNKSN